MLLLASYESQGNLTIQAAGGIAFQHPPTGGDPTSINGNVCGHSFFTGDPVDDAGNGDYILEHGSNAYQGGCGTSSLIALRSAAMGKIAEPTYAALGGKGFGPGTYSSVAAFTVADNTNVTLTGGPNDVFLFLSDSYMVTGHNSNIILADGVQAKNVLFVLTGYFTSGADSELHGSVLAGAAVTLGDRSDVSGYVLATAAMTIGEECRLNLAGLTSTSVVGDVVTSPVETLINNAL